jgi:hypothetical protein
MHMNALAGKRSTNIVTRTLQRRAHGVVAELAGHERSGDAHQRRRGRRAEHADRAALDAREHVHATYERVDDTKRNQFAVGARPSAHTASNTHSSSSHRSLMRVPINECAAHNARTVRGAWQLDI